MIPIKLTNDTWPPKDGEFCSSIVLYYDNWNDYSYRTSFVMCYCDADGMVREVGNVKIYYWQNDEVRTNQYSEHTKSSLGDHIESLSASYCSLGQELSYYKNLKALLPNDYFDILTRLNDIAIFDAIKNRFINEKGVQSSLLDEFDNLTPSDSHPPMRILRRNFATVIQACTDLSLEEKEYIFGHRISGKDGAKKRIEYNRNMDRLWRIAQKLDKAPFCKKLYELHFPQIIVGDGIVVQEGRGQGTIRIPWESAVYGQKLHLHFEGGPNTSVSISTPNAVRPFGGLPVEVKMADAPISWGDPLPPINAEAMHWEAVRKVRYLKKTDK